MTSEGYFHFHICGRFFFGLKITFSHDNDFSSLCLQSVYVRGARCPRSAIGYEGHMVGFEAGLDYCLPPPILWGIQDYQT